MHYIFLSTSKAILNLHISQVKWSILRIQRIGVVWLRAIHSLMHRKCTKATDPEHLHGVNVISYMVFRDSKQILHQGSLGATTVDLRLSSCVLPTDTKHCTRFSWLQFINIIIHQREGHQESSGHRNVEYMKQSPNVVAVRIPLEQNQRFAVQFLLSTLFLALALAELFDGAGEQGLAVGFGPFLDEGWTERHVFTVDYVVAENSNVGLAAPTTFLLREDQRKAVDLEDRADDWHEAWEVLIKQFEVADERQEFIDARPKYFYFIEDEMIIDGFRL